MTIKYISLLFEHKLFLRHDYISIFGESEKIPNFLIINRNACGALIDWKVHSP